MRTRVRPFRAVWAVLSVLVLGAAGSLPAQAATSTTFGPVTITGIPAAPPVGTPATQKVVPLATIEASVTVGVTTYVYSTLRAYAADQVNLIDNEIRCSGAGASNVVMGENVLPPGGDPAHQDITIVNRFLVSATSTGTLTCTLYLRTASTSIYVAQETVSGELRFASTSVGEDINGAALQTSLGSGDIPVPSTTYTPILDRTLPSGYTTLAVIADMEYHRCASGYTCPSNTSTARFTLFVNTDGGPACDSAPIAQTSESVARGVNHAAVPLYTTVTLKPGCTHVYAYVRTEHVSDDVGSIGGAASGLTDSTGQSGDTPNHTSAMTHIFAVPS